MNWKIKREKCHFRGCSAYTLFLLPLLFVCSAEWDTPSQGHVHRSEGWKEAFGPFGRSDRETSGKRNVI